MVKKFIKYLQESWRKYPIINETSVVVAVKAWLKDVEQYHNERMYNIVIDELVKELEK